MKGPITLINCSFAKRIGLTASLAVAGVIAFAGAAHADYQQTLAARGADAYTPTSAIIRVEQEDLDEAFSQASLVSTPALSDQEVMVDLQSRMDSANHLEQAAADLDPQAVADVLSGDQVASVTTPSAADKSTSEEAAAQESSTETAGEQPAAIASR